VTPVFLSPLSYASDAVDHNTEKNKEIVLSVFSALETGNLELLNSVFLPEGK